MNILKGLEKLGLANLTSRDIFENKSKKENKEEKIITVQEILYDKTYTCPVCDTVFKTKALRTGKNRLIRSDSDLKGYYSIIDPIIYDVITCTCGYTAMSKTFNTVLNAQRGFIKKDICSNYKPVSIDETRIIEDAIVLYKLALANAMVKLSKNLEKGLICLRIAWLYRDLKDETNEKVYLQNAIIGFKEAVSKERFPMLGLDDSIAMYLVADLSYRVDEKEEALRWLSTIITCRGASARIKDKALDLKQLIRAEGN